MRTTRIRNLGSGMLLLSAYALSLVGCATSDGDAQCERLDTEVGRSKQGLVNRFRNSTGFGRRQLINRWRNLSVRTFRNASNIQDSRNDFFGPQDIHVFDSAELGITGEDGRISAAEGTTLATWIDDGERFDLTLRQEVEASGDSAAPRYAVELAGLNPQ